MILLLVGILLWSLSHGFKRIAPAQRKALGNRGKILTTASILLGLILMIIGYQQADLILIWSPPQFLRHLNNFLMLLSVASFAAAHSKGRIRGLLRHPMLTSVKIWAIAHLLVNGDLASIVLFGSMLLWAVWTVVQLNRAGNWQRPEPGNPKSDWLFVVITLVVFTVISGIHVWLGVSPFGSYS